MRSILIGLLLAVAVAAPAAAQTSPAAKPADEVKRIVEQTYNVQVLRVTEAALEDGTAVYKVAAMLPGTAGNAAFMVNTLTVDPETGLTLPPFRHHAAGYSLPQGGSYEPNRTSNNPAVARGHTWR
ncbi:hypothetical protein JJL56_05300 [Azospirillum sp. YIM DDC1]|uniref:PepSY domain-containing protein n=1 Tax=Azospirillum aestuarii TaxID=2802052 RepID=A0ABS1HTY4_9PROT|nr:hypothetical protein [Azospirillum aestuarii]MBK4718281.1 hypothetical protein [Azospirillum aestuarii]